jgi:hypothetical protein
VSTVGCVIYYRIGVQLGTTLAVFKERCRLIRSRMVMEGKRGNKKQKKNGALRLDPINN